MMMNSWSEVDLDRIYPEQLPRQPQSQASGAVQRKRSRLWVYALCGGFFCMGFFGVALAVGEDRFAAKAIIVSVDGQEARPFRQLLAAGVPEPVLRHIAEAQRLDSDPEFVTRDSNWLKRAAHLAGWHIGAGGDDNLTRAVQSLKGVLQIGLSPDPGRLEVQVALHDAEKAARVADFAAQAIADAQAGHESVSSQAMANAAEDLAARLRIAEQRLAAFQLRQSEEQINDQTGSIADVPALAAAKADMDRIARALAAGRMSGLNDLHFPTPELDRAASQYADLQQQYEKLKLTLGDKHPDLLAIEGQVRALQKDIHGQWQKLAEIANRNYRAAQARVLAFGADDKAPAKPGAAANGPALDQLQSDVDLARADYAAAKLQAKAPLGEAQGSWRVIEAELPSAPFHEPHGLILGGALMLGAMFGAGRTLVQKRGKAAPPPGKDKPQDSRRDDRQGTPQNKRQGTPPERIIPLPRIKGSWFADILGLKPPLDVSCWEVLERPSSDFSKMVEGLVEMMEDATDRRPVKILVVTDESGSGGTVLAVNVAQLAAKLGHRTLLIEANRQHPVLASLISPDVRANWIALDGTRRLICQLRQKLSVIPLFGAEEETRLAARAHHCVKGISRHFDIAVIDGGTFEPDDRDMREMADVVNGILFLTRDGIEWKKHSRALSQVA